MCEVDRGCILKGVANTKNCPCYQRWYIWLKILQYSYILPYSIMVTQTSRQLCCFWGSIYGETVQIEFVKCLIWGVGRQVFTKFVTHPQIQMLSMFACSIILDVNFWLHLSIPSGPRNPHRTSPQCGTNGGCTVYSQVTVLRLRLANSKQKVSY